MVAIYGLYKPDPTLPPMEPSEAAKMPIPNGYTVDGLPYYDKASIYANFTDGAGRWYSSKEEANAAAGGADVGDASEAAQKKAERWAEYQERNGIWSYSRWSSTYDANQERAKKAGEAVNDYRAQLGWGQTEVTIDVEVDGVVVKRRLDIADIATNRGVEVKTGYQYLTAENLWEVKRDEQLVKQGIDIQWVFRDREPSAPLAAALKKAGIVTKIGF
jgi:hypothetical protein